MKSIRIDMTGEAPRLDFNQEVRGFGNTIQRGMVNIGTHRNKDNLFDKKGTNLLLRGVEGSLVSLQEARHQSNFAAVETLRFLKSTAPNTLDERESLSRVGLEPATPILSGRLSVSASFTSESGEVVGVTGNL